MSNWLPGRYVPIDVPGAKLTVHDMARVSADDWADIRTLARGYCRKVDGTHSRKRMDGSATVARYGYAPYGTDDVSDDVTQDAVLLFAQKFARITETCPISAMEIATREPCAW